ncbi:MAG: hypothetical protein ACYC8T_31025 [Myxococcaceae bacterium]
MPGDTLTPDVAGAAARLAHLLEREHIEYAIGGAIALGLHGFARATRDVDINVFVEPPLVPRLLALLDQAGLRVEAGALERATIEGWFTAWDGAVRLDLFIPSIDFSWEARRMRQRLSFLGEDLWFLSAESLCVFKLLFFRTKDLADLEQLVLTSDSLDRSAVRAAVVSMMGEGDERVRAWDAIVREFAPRQ